MRTLYRVGRLLILSVSIFLLVGQATVYRYPALSFDPEPMRVSDARHPDWKVHLAGAYQKQSDNWAFRASEPGVALQVVSNIDNLSSVIKMENIHPEARLKASSEPGKLSEIISGLTRTIKFTHLMQGETLNLQWIFPERTRYRFAVFGDSGGGKELDWGLMRAKALGADFVLHLGDAYYDEGSVGTVSDRLNQSQIPVYVSNGNHDFRGPSGNSIDVFLNNIGPLNARFSLVGHCFINLDSGAYMYPPHKGERAALLAAEIANSSACSEYIVFTHKPILDDFEAEFPQRTHSLHRYDAHWLIDQLKKLGKVTIMAGHIHRNFEFEQDGMKTFVSGNGLAQTDLFEQPHSAQMLLGEIKAGEPLQTSWASYDMPMDYHCSAKILKSLRKSKSKMLEVVEKACR